MCGADFFVWEVELESIVVRHGDFLIVWRKMLNAEAYAFILSVLVVWTRDVLSELLHGVIVNTLV